MTTRVEGYGFNADRLSDFQKDMYQDITQIVRQEMKILIDVKMDKAKFSEHCRKMEIQMREFYKCGYYLFFNEPVVHVLPWGFPANGYPIEDLSYVWKQVVEYEYEEEPCSWNRRLSWQVIDGFDIHKIMQSLVRKGNGHVQNA